MCPPEKFSSLDKAGFLADACEKLRGADWLSASGTQKVMQLLEDGGEEARVVGGAVRNTLVGRPVSDIDIATTALPDKTIALARARKLKTIATGPAHGTVTVLAHGTPYEVTTLRRDVETDGRHAEVAFTRDWEADAGRRDFTINALYCSREGELFDPLGGIADLAARRVRFIGDADQRIAEDYLRIFRFYRFSAEYAGGDFDAKSLEACARGALGLSRLSAERIRAELLRILLAPRVSDAVRAMLAYGTIVAALNMVPQVSRLVALVAREAEAGIAPHPIRRLAAFLGTGAHDVTRLAGKLRLSNAEAARLGGALSQCGGATGDVTERALRHRVSRSGRDAVTDQLLLAASVERTDPGELRTAVDLVRDCIVPAFPLSGRDILALGVPAGPAVGDVLAELESDWLANDFVADKAALLAQANALLARR